MLDEPGRPGALAADWGDSRSGPGRLALDIDIARIKRDWQGEVRVIDFPQVTDPRFNRHARDLLSRDVENICRYFNAYGVEADAGAISSDLWRRFTFALL